MPILTYPGRREGADVRWARAGLSAGRVRRLRLTFDRANTSYPLREAAGLPRVRFHDLRHTVIIELLEAGEPDHVVESITGHLSRRMLEHYSHIRIDAKKRALDRLDELRKAANEQ